jgi:MFS family permease
MINIIFIGLVSFFADLSTEMVYPLIPIYLTTVLGATPALVGVIEGIAESLASLLKVFSGYVSDKYRKKKPIAFLGYAAGLLYKLALIFAGSWVGILGARVLDRFGKGIRTAPRDVLVSESGDKAALGRAFGLHKTLDMLGSASGVLIAILLVATIKGVYPFKSIFLLSAIPALLSLFMFIFIKETSKPREGRKPLHLWQGFKEADSRLKLYLVVVFLFTLGNSSNAFLLLRAGNSGFSAVWVLVLYLAYNLISGLLSIPFGRLSDKIGRKRILVSGYLVFALTYGLFAWGANMPMIAAAFLIYGFFTAMVAGVERAFIAELSPPDLKGTMLGLQSTIVGVALLPASMIAGFLWDLAGPAAAFGLGSALSLLAALILAFGLKANPLQKAAAKEGT